MSPGWSLTLNLRGEGVRGYGVRQVEWEGDLRWERQEAGGNVVGSRSAGKGACILHSE